MDKDKVMDGLIYDISFSIMGGMRKRSASSLRSDEFLGLGMPPPVLSPLPSLRAQAPPLIYHSPKRRRVLSLNGSRAVAGFLPPSVVATNASLPRVTGQHPLATPTTAPPSSPHSTFLSPMVPPTRPTAPPTPPTPPPTRPTAPPTPPLPPPTRPTAPPARSTPLPTRPAAPPTRPKHSPTPPTPPPTRCVASRADSRASRIGCRSPSGSYAPPTDSSTCAHGVFVSLACGDCENEDCDAEEMKDMELCRDLVVHV